MSMQRGLGWVAACMLMAAPAFGHAKLLNSRPAADSQVATSPKNLALEFNEAVKLARLTVTIDGRVIPIRLDAGAAATAKVEIPLPVLSPGLYVVQWSALTVDDGHVVKGGYSFTVRGAT